MKVPFTGCVLKEYPAGSITQYFAENPELYKRFDMKGHNGIDLVAKHGTPLVAVESGTVVEVKNTPEGYGKHLRLITKKGNEWTYGHCDEIFVKIGDEVAEGQDIATMGNTGFVVSDGYAGTFWGLLPKGNRGTHVHLGLRKVKRTAKGWSYPGSKIKIDVLDYGNGYKGSVDPLPLFGAKDPNIENLELQVSLLTKVLELYKRLFK